MNVQGGPWESMWCGDLAGSFSLDLTDHIGQIEASGVFAGALTHHLNGLHGRHRHTRKNATS